MSCINLSIPAPQIPPILLGLPAFNFTLSFPPIPLTIGISCCHFTVPGVQIPIQIPIPLPAIYFQAINAALFAAFQLLQLNIPDCPNNGAEL